MKNKLALFIFLFTAISGMAFAQENLGKGKIVKGVYKNKYFGLELPFPEEWVVQDKEEVAQITDMGKQMFSDDKNMKKVLDATKLNDQYLLAIFKHELGTPGVFNPSLFLIGNNIEPYPGIKTGKEYLFQVGRILLASGLDYDIEDEFEKQRIDTKDFYVLKATLTVGEYSVHQHYFSTVLKGHALGIVVTWTTDEEKQELYAIIDKVKI